MVKRRYQFFTTTLPDQFVEANAVEFVDACRHWQDVNVYVRQAIVIEGVSLSLCGSRKAHTIPMIVSNSPTQITNWMDKYGDSFNGRYWETFAQDNGRADRKPNRRAGTKYISTVPAPSWRTINSIANPGQGPGLSLIDHSKMMQDLMTKQMNNAILYGSTGPMFRGMQVFIDELEERCPPLKRESIACGEIIGYRCWLVITDNGRPLLRSVYQKDFWLPNKPLEGRGLEDWDSRGIHAWKRANSKQFFEYIREYLDNSDTFTRFSHEITRRPTMATGRVALWGDVVEHEHGYRAEFARIKSIDWLYPDQSMMGREPEVLTHLRKLYGVDHD